VYVTPVPSFDAENVMFASPETNSPANPKVVDLLAFAATVPADVERDVRRHRRRVGRRRDGVEEVAEIRYGDVLQAEPSSTAAGRDLV